MKIYTISPSRLQLYSDCPRCFFLQATGHRQMTTGAMTFGTRLHKAIEDYHKEVYVPDFAPDLKPFMEEYMAMYDQEYQVAEDFWNVQLLDTDIMFKTKVDLVKDDLLIDHKTSARPYTQEFVDGNRQLTGYAWAWRQLYTEPEKGVRINLFLTNAKAGEPLLQTIDTYRDESHFTEWTEWVREILAGIEADQFEAKEARWHNFRDCPFYKEREV